MYFYVVICILNFYVVICIFFSKKIYVVICIFLAKKTGLYSINCSKVAFFT